MRPVPTDGVITLRPFRLEDLISVYTATLETAATLRAWMTWCPPSYSVEDCGHFLSQTTEDWTSDKSYNFAITDVCKDAFLGSIALNKINRSHNSANVGYWVRQSRAGRGIASRALTLVAGFAFSELHFHRLEIVVPDGNIASQRVAQKAGAAFEGVHRQKIILNGKPHDGIVYSLINPSGAGPSCGG